MKPRSILCLCTSSVVFSVAPRAAAVDLYWDADGATTGATGGTSTWNTSTALWRNGSSTGTLQNYDNTSPSSTVAVFGGTAGTVTLSGTLNAGGLNFGVGGYTLTGGTLNLIPSGGNFVITTNGGTTNLNSALNFSAANTMVTKTGAGTLVLGNAGAGTTNQGFYTVTGGTFNSGTGTFDSILSMVAGNRLGTGGSGTPPQVTLSAGTLQLTQSGNNNNLAASRGVLVTASGGAIVDGGGGSFLPSAITNNAGAGTSLYLSNVSGLTQFQGAISGTGSVTWYGAGTASFQTANSYAGGTFLRGGTIQVTNSSALSTGALTFTGAGTLQSGAANLNLANNINLGTNSTIFDTNGNTFTLSGAISNSAATNQAIKAAGTGTLVLAGALNLTGGGDTDNPALFLGNRNGANFNRGTVNITGTGAISRISTGWDNTANTLNFASTGTVTMSGDLVTGQSANGVGVINHTTGTLTTQNLNLANWDGSFGAYNMSGGTLNTVNLRNGGNGNGNGNSYMVMSGGTVNVSSTTTFSRNGNGTNVLYLNGAGAQFNAGTNNLNLAFSTDSTGIVTVNAGLLTVNSNILLANGGTSSTFGIVNLNGGTARVNAIGSANAGGNSIVNFNGGTLQALNDNAGFMAGLTSANIFSGGATIDTNGKNITVGQVLRGATGNGVSSTIPVTNGGAGYLSAPVVKITGGGGTGDTAVAIVNGGVVTGIQLTSAGTGYTSAPTVSLVGGGATTAATLGTVTTVTNANTGGFTKTGTGVLTLTGANTYAGATAINGGVLATNNLQANGTASGIGQGTALNLNGGTLRYTGGANANGFNRTINVGAGGGTLDNQGGQFVFYDGSLAGSGAVSFVDSSGSNHEWLVTGNSAGYSGNVSIGNGSAGSGVVQYRSNNANPLGTGTVTINGGGVLTADGGTTTPTTLGNNLVLNGGLLGTQGSAMAYTGTISLAASSTVGAVPGYGTNTIDLTGAISGGSSAALNIATTSEVTISNNANTYTGATNVNSGKLVINGNISTSLLTTVNSGATIGGVGTVGDLTVLAGATFDPGNSIGTLTVDGALSLAGISSFEINTAGDLADLGNATGLLTFGGTLNVTNIGAALQNGDTFDLFNWGSATGTFSNVNLPTLDGPLSWDQSNLYVNGTIAVVPEPKAALLGGLAFLVLLRRKRQIKG